MRKSMTTMMMLMTSMFGCAACSSDGASKEATDVSANDNVSTDFQIQYTTPVPSDFFQAATQQGTIELVEYDSKDYTQSSRPATKKPAYVYVPYGYDPSKQYDVIYLLHGWTGVAEEYFLGRSGSSRTGLVHIFDNLIQRGLCRPFIAVSPTWDKDNRSKDWGESTREAAVFSQEYVNDLIPAVETRYSTYLAEATPEGILASRAHRAIGGFSLGSITTWYVFEQAFAYSRMYLPMSGDNWSQGMYGGAYYPDATAKFLADLVNTSPYKNDFYVWYAVGTEDVRIDQTHNQALAMAKLTDTFNVNTFSYHMKEGGRHDFNAVWEFCYHALQFFFPTNEASAYYMQKILFTAVMMTALLTACSSDDDNNTNAPIEPIDNPNGKTLVVYFSKTVPDGVDASTGATQVFNYKDRELGATQWVAQQIADRTGADMHRITVADGYYPVTYNELADFARNEKEAGTHPVLTSMLTNLADYQNIIIGTPVWWYTVPMPIYSFLDAYDLSGKKIMVFTTHEGSGLADAISVIRQQEPQASVNATGFQTRGASAGSQSNAINEWLNGLGYK